MPSRETEADPTRYPIESKKPVEAEVYAKQTENTAAFLIRAYGEKIEYAIRGLEGLSQETADSYLKRITADRALVDAVSGPEQK